MSTTPSVGGSLPGAADCAPGQQNRWAGWLARNATRRFNMATKIGWDAFVNAAPREPLVTLSRGDMAALSAEELEDYNEARTVWHANPAAVRTSQVATAFALIDQVMASNRRDGDRLRGSVVIDAAPALGKTTIATRYAREFHRRAYRRLGPFTDQGHQRLPVAYVALTGNTTLKGLNRQILSFYGHPAAGRATSADLAAVAVECVSLCETQLLVVDDLHFIDFDHRDGKQVSNHLKGLANAMPTTFMFTGVRLAERRFFSEGLLGADAEYAQTARRATRCPVSRFTLATDAGFRAWVDLLAALEPQLILAEATAGVLTRHARELHRRTQGHIGSLTMLIEHACHLAIATGTEDITTDILDRAATDNAADTSAASISTAAAAG